MNDFTKEELQHLYELVVEDEDISINSDYHKFFENIIHKIQSMIDNYCEHEWRCWDDENNTRECIKCGERRDGEI